MSESLLWIILLGLFFFLMFRGGKHGMGCCGGHDHGSHGDHSSPSSDKEQAHTHHH